MQSAKRKVCLQELFFTAIIPVGEERMPEYAKNRFFKLVDHICQMELPFNDLVATDRELFSDVGDMGRPCHSPYRKPNPTLT